MSAVPDGWQALPLWSIAPEVRTPVASPAPGVTYELWSVPAFAARVPEVVDGRAIGSAKRPVAVDDVLICKINPRLNRVWTVKSGSSHPMIASPEWVVVRPRRDHVEAAYLTYYLSSPSFRDWIVGETSGVTGSHTRAKPRRILTHPIPLPALSEQRRIVEILEDNLSRLDAAADGLRMAARRTTGYEDALIMRNLGLQRGDGRGVARLVGGDVPDLAAGWTWQTLDQVAEVVGGVTKDAKKRADPGAVEVPYLRVANVQRARLVLDDVATIRVPAAKATALRLEPGDVLMNEGGDRDKLARGWVWEGQIDACIHQNHVFRARPSDRVHPEWLAWCANSYGSRWAQRHGRQSVNLASISLRTLKTMPVPVAPLEEQHLRLRDIRPGVEASRRLAAETEAALARGRVLRRALLAAAFSGRLTGSSSDTERVEELAEAMG